MARERREETRSGKEMVVSIWEAIRVSNKPMRNDLAHTKLLLEGES
jgi:hypothetical protein